MRRELILLLIAIPSWGWAQQVTAAQLQSAVSELAGRFDDSAAAKLAAMELTERLPAGVFAQINARLHGKKSHEALVVLADMSEFRDPPPSEIPPAPAPDPGQQRAIMSRTVDYVLRTHKKLPNFFANRSTSRYEDWPKGLEVKGMVPVRIVPPSLVDVEKITVTYRNGEEVVTTVKKRDRGYTGLSAWGLFGPVLTTVLFDAGHGMSAWSRWELRDGKQVAVFRYAVAMDQSHYNLKFCCYPLLGILMPIDRLSAYHGEMAVDPDDGAIVRLTLIADIDQGDVAFVMGETIAGSPLESAEMMVEYAPVEIGGKTYVCPKRSVAVSRARVPRRVTSLEQAGSNHLVKTVHVELGPARNYVNDAVFTDYHIFRSESRLIY